MTLDFEKTKERYAEKFAYSSTICTNCLPIDNLLGEGLYPGVVTHIYGPGASGKTNVALVLAINAALSGKSVIFIDTEGGFSFERLKQIAGDNFDQVLRKIVLFSPITFDEQALVIKDLEVIVEKNSEIKFIVVDSISHLYRLERSEKDKMSDANYALSKQIHILLRVARKFNMPILLTNQVYSLFDSANDEFVPVAGDILKYSSKIILRLENKGFSLRKVSLQKHLFKREGLESTFEIVENGIR